MKNPWEQDGAENGEPLSFSSPENNNEIPEGGEPVQKKRTFLLVLEGIGLLILVPALLLVLLYRNTRLIVAAEMTGSLPEAALFARNGEDAEYRMDTSSIRYKEPCVQLVKVAVAGKPRLCLLVLEDTTPPAADFVSMTIGAGETLTADKFITNLKDAQPVAVSFRTKPVFGKTGEQQVAIRLMDLSGNESTVSGLLTIRDVKSTELVLEAGGPLPEAGSLAYHAGDKVQYISGADEIDTSVPGVYSLEVEVEGNRSELTVTVEDTVPPDFTVKTVFLKPGETASVEDFLDTSVDETALTFRMLNEPDYTSRDIQQVLIEAEDLGGNKTVCSAELFISPIPAITVEADDTYLRAETLGEDVKILSHLKLNKTGAYMVKCSASGEECYALVTVEDTVAPVVKTRDAEGYLHFEPDPSILIKSVRDKTDVTFEFKTAPDKDSEEPQEVTVICTDGGGNVTEVTAVLTLTPDTTPPVLYCPKTTYCYIGDTVSYFAEVAAEDDRYGEVDITVDNSLVNIYGAGTYPVTYIATDLAGNETRVTVNFVFIEPGVTEEQYNEAVDALYNKIITPGMDLKHQGKAIFDWVYKHMTYHARSNKKDWKYEAWRGITYKVGDCFTFCAVARALLEKAGAKIMVVTREGGWANTHHWWLLVDLGTGYYHYDPINVGPKNYKCFMRTDAEVKKKNRMFWAFDSSKYPATPTEKFELD